MDSWTDELALGALDAARAHTHPLRVYFWVGTGRGYSVLYEMWEQAEGSVVTRQIFIGWWRLDTHVLDPNNPDQAAAWEVYGTQPPSQDESEWMAEVSRRFGVVISQEQLAWWRFTKTEGKGINDNEALALQEHPWLPEQSFQASGSAFISATTALRLRTSISRAPVPTGYRYDWWTTFDENGDDVMHEIEMDDEDASAKTLRAAGAQLVIWEQPMSNGLYITAGDPAYGSSEKADSFAVTVWRAHPDQLVQVATYHAHVGTMYQFAWVLAHLACNYPSWLIYDVNGPGTAVLQELKRLKDRGLGLTRRHGSLRDVVGGIQEYLWTRADTLTPTFSWQWRTGANTQEPLMEQLRNEVERGALVIRDPELVSEVAALRRDKGRIEPGGVAHDDLAVTAAMAVEYWLNTVMEEVEATVAPRNTPEVAPPAEERLLKQFLRRLQIPEEPPTLPMPYGVKPGGPGR